MVSRKWKKATSWWTIIPEQTNLRYKGSWQYRSYLSWRLLWTGHLQALHWTCFNGLFYQRLMQSCSLLVVCKVDINVNLWGGKCPGLRNWDLVVSVSYSLCCWLPGLYYCSAISTRYQLPTQLLTLWSSLTSSLNLRIAWLRTLSTYSPITMSHSYLRSLNSSLTRCSLQMTRGQRAMTRISFNTSRWTTMQTLTGQPHCQIDCNLRKNSISIAPVGQASQYRLLILLTEL